MEPEVLTMLLSVPIFVIIAVGWYWLGVNWESSDSK